MAVIRVKRGTSKPTTSNLTYLGELAFNYSTNELFARSSSSIVKIGGEMEKVYFYEGYASSHQWNYSFDASYIYKIHVIASTNGGVADTSQTIINYKLSTGNASGTFVNIMNDDVYNGSQFTTGRNTTTFYINDAFSNSVKPNYAVTKVIDFEFSPTFESSYSYSYQWVAYGRSVCTVSDQSDAPLTFVQFAHSVNGPITGFLINPGLDLGSNDPFSITVYRIKRK